MYLNGQRVYVNACQCSLVDIAVGQVRGEHGSCCGLCLYTCILSAVTVTAVTYVMELADTQFTIAGTVLGYNIGCQRYGLQFTCRNSVPGIQGLFTCLQVVTKLWGILLQRSLLLV